MDRKKKEKYAQRPAVKMNEWKSAGQAEHESRQGRALESIYTDAKGFQSGVLTRGGQSTVGWDPTRKLWSASKYCLSIRQTPCRQKVEAMTLKCFNKQYCVMKSQYKQLSMLKLKEMTNTKLLSWLRVSGVCKHFVKQFQNYWLRGSEHFFVISVISGDAWSNLITEQTVIVNDI